MPRPKASTLLDKQALIRFARDYRRGMPLRELADKYAMPISAVSRIRNQLGLPKREARRVTRIASVTDLAAARAALNK